MVHKNRRISFLILTLSVILSLSICFQETGDAEAASAALFSTSYVTTPGALYSGQSFVLKGIIKSRYKMKSVRAGICTTAGKWIRGEYGSADPAAKSYNLNRLDYKVAFGKAAPGTYRYVVWAKDVKGSSSFLIYKKFTVSKFTASGVTKPETIKKGASFTLKGKVSSTYKLSNAKVGITTTTGKWKTGSYVSVNPGSRTYDIAKADSKIRFGSLAGGTYYYKVMAKDSKGISKYVVSKKFKVTSTSASNGSVPVASGKKLSYNSTVIKSIGSQCPSGCAIYSMAYCRAVLDGKFTRGSYPTIRSRIINQYGMGSVWAHWARAGGTSIYFTTNSSCYRYAITQLNNNRPCILLVHNGYTGNTHYVALVGYVAGTTSSNAAINKFIALDPAYGGLRYLSTMRYYNTSTPQLVTF